MTKLDLKKLNNTIRYTMRSAFKVTPSTLDDNRGETIAKTKEFPARYEDTDLIIRGFCDASVMRAKADFMFWIHVGRMEDLQAFYNASLRETPLNQAPTPH